MRLEKIGIGKYWGDVLVCSAFLGSVVICLAVAGRYFHAPPEVVWGRGAFIFCSGMVLMCAPGFVKIRLLRIGATAVCLLLLELLVLLQLLEFYNFSMQGDTFNFAFYMNMFDIGLIREQLPHQIKECCVGVGVLVVVGAFFVLAAVRCGGARGKTAVVLFPPTVAAWLMILVSMQTAPGNFVSMLKQVYDNSEENLRKAAPVEDVRYFEQFGITVSEVGRDNLRILRKGNGKNLVIIMLESMEVNYTDEKVFPGLTPNLNRLKSLPGTLVFDRVASRAGCTNEAKFCVSYGMPVSPAFGVRFGQNYNVELLEKFVSLQYIFKKAGYSWSHVEIPVIDRSQIELLKGNGVFLDWKEELGLGDDFGKCDHWLFGYAWQIFQNRMAGQQPFCLFIMTADAHAPNGIVDEYTLPYPNKAAFPAGFGKFQMLDAVYNCDHHLGAFVDKVLASPAGKDTCIVIMNDHLSMTDVDGFLRRKEPRRELFMILNTDRTEHISTWCCQWDLPPTILELLQIETNYQFPCGESVLSEPTKEFNLRTKVYYDREPLSRFTLWKNGKVRQESTKITVGCDDENSAFINVLGTEIFIPRWDRVLGVVLDKKLSATDSWVGGNRASVEKQLAREKDMVCLFTYSEELAELFLPGVALPENLNLCRYVLVYRMADGKKIAVAAYERDLLELDVSAESPEAPALKTVSPAGTVRTLKSGDFSGAQPDPLGIAFSENANFIEASTKFPLVENVDMTISATLENRSDVSATVSLVCNMFDRNGKPLTGGKLWKEEIKLSPHEIKPVEFTFRANEDSPLPGSNPLPGGAAAIQPRIECAMEGNRPAGIVIREFSVSY